MAESKCVPDFKLTPEQRKIVDDVRRQIEQEKPEILAEGKRVFAAEESIAGRLQAAMGILKAVRKSHGITLDQVAEKTGMTKPYLSKLENDVAANVTINTLYRIADALGHDVQVSIIPREQLKPDPKKPVTSKPKGKGLAHLAGKNQAD